MCFTQNDSFDFDTDVAVVGLFVRIYFISDTLSNMSLLECAHEYMHIFSVAAG